MTATEHKSDFKLTSDTPYLTLMDELWGVYYENFEKKINRVITAPHFMCIIMNWFIIAVDYVSSSIWCQAII